MKITIEGPEKEIAALVSELQEWLETYRAQKGANNGTT